ncbi:MAG: ABC transporter ATP-binding protein [Chloroflexota bacterium]|nr:MAG: ABC transporter ATP-binding protein [Chloroflexota bacterium]
MNESNTWVVDTQELSKSYNGVQALKPLNLQVARNSIFGFLGPNGAGKTTTIKLLLGLIRPSGGSARVFGLDIAHDSIAIRGHVGYLPQDPRFYEHMTAREILRYTARFYFRGPKAEIERRVDETLDLVGLSDKADRPVKSFSGGERQRVGIGQAQVNYPDLLILDEPAASLDPMGRRDVLAVMERLRKYTTIFYCTHILDDVQRVSDTVAILNHGRLVAHGPIEELLAGGEGTVYSVTMKGAVDGAHKRVIAQEWVRDIQVKPRNGATTWSVAVDDQAAAEASLLRLLLADEQLVVTDFRRREYDLEDVFVKIVEAQDHDSG